MSDGNEALQRLYDDPAVVRAMEVLEEHAITGAQYDQLVKSAPPIRYEPDPTCYTLAGMMALLDERGRYLYRSHG